MLRITRAGDVRRRYLKSLEEEGVVECFEREWRLVNDWHAVVDSLNEQDREIEREKNRGLTTDERLKERHKAQQKAFRNRHKTQADPAPSNGDLAIQRRERERRCAAGEIRELEKLPPQLKPPDLYPLMGSPVETLRGCGKLWQAFSGRVGVLLDEEPDYVTFIDLVEVLGGV